MDMSTVENATGGAHDAPSNGSLKPSSTHHLRRPHLLSRNSADKSAGLNGSAHKSAISAPPSPSTARKNSWISGLASKFTSVPSSTTTTTTTSQAAKPMQDRLMPAPSARRASLTHAVPPPLDDAAPYVPASPKTSQPSFLQSALRRFQSSTQVPGVSKMGSGGLCERRVMNVDASRERCRVQGLEQAKLRRVAFCVDVEIAGAPRYNDDAEGTKKRKKESKKLKEKGEGEALKHPEQVQAEKDQEGVVEVSGERVESSDAAETQPNEPEQANESQGEQRESNGNDHSQTVEEGTLKVAEASLASTPPADQPHRSHDQPTTDPLRIYRRCCQLRETSPLKRVVEQATAPPTTTPGTVTTLDLSDMLLPLADVVTLADWLAVVPVRELKLDNCGLGDEAVRVLLGALLAAKLNHSSTVKADLANSIQVGMAHGFIEKLNLKNNPKIGRDGWKHISLFLHLSHSIRSVDLSMIPFPRPLPDKTQKDPAWDMAALLAEAIGERYAGPQLEELILSACQLTTEDVTKIAGGASKSGLRRLELANNPDCRVAAATSDSTVAGMSSVVALHTDEGEPVTTLLGDAAVDDEDRAVHARPSQHGSDVSMASRALAMEEGHLHRIGHQVRRDIFGSRSSSPAPASSPSPRPSVSVSSDITSTIPTTTTTTTEVVVADDPATNEDKENDDAEQLAMLQKRIEDVGGMDLRARILQDGYEATLKNLGMTLDDIQRLAMLDPESYAVLRQAQDMATKNAAMDRTVNAEEMS